MSAPPESRNLPFPSSPAGGRATQAGMGFQAGVSVWFAAHLLSKAPVGTRLGLSRGAIATKLQFETGRNLDDIEIQLSDGSLVSVQCKTTLTLSAAERTPLAKVVGQLVNLHRIVAKTGERACAVLAVSKRAPGSLEDLNRACRLFDEGATWTEVHGLANLAERAALDVFRTQATRAWDASSQITDVALAELARLFRVVRFDVEQGGADWREAANMLRTSLYDEATTAESALVELQHIAQELIRKGSPSDREGWLRAARAAGLEDRHAPGFDADIKKLRDWTAAELERLKRHAVLVGGTEIPRQCHSALSDAIAGGSLLVVGEPGAGKTGVLVRYARELVSARAPTVFLSVDDLAAITDSTALRNALGIENDLLDVLAAWPGTSPGVLVIDALDASRGGASEAVFARAIESVTSHLGERWSVVASIRTFDLQHGKRLRTLMQGSPPRPEYSEPGLESVRHFSIKKLLDDELSFIGEENDALGRLLSAAPATIRDLLRNVFNLSLAAELVHKGLPPEAIQSVTSQSQLISRYEDERLSTHRLRRAVTDVVTEMARQERLVIKQDRVHNDALDEVIATGMVVQAPQDRISFAHHVLFDHAVGRFYLDLTDAAALTAQVAGQPAIGLLLGPGLRFAIMDLWETGPAGRSAAWRLAADLASHSDMDPVVGSIALRTVIDSVRVPEDARPLIDLLNQREQWPQTGHVLSRASRFLMVGPLAQSERSPSLMLAWAEVACAAAATGAVEQMDGVRILLLSLMERGDFEDMPFSRAFGAAARSLLSAMLVNAQFTSHASSGIRFVARSFDSDPRASQQLLEKMIEEPRFSAHAPDEAPWLAEGTRYMLRTAPAFVERIYATLFGRESPQEGNSWLGTPSKILPLRSNRKQDYEHARWHLEQVLPKFLEVSPEHATRAVSSSTVGLIKTESPEAERHLMLVPRHEGQRPVRIVGDRFSLQEWREEEDHDGTERRILHAFTNYLRSCSAENFRLCAEAALSGETSSSVMARLFGIAAERPEIIDDLLWPIATSPDVLTDWGLSRDAITYVANALPRQREEDRRRFESELLQRVGAADDDTRKQWAYRARRLLSLVAAENLISSELAEYRSQLHARGELTGNPAYISISSGWVGQDDDIVGSLLRSEGVDTNAGPDAAVMAAVRPLEKHLKAATEELDRPGVRIVWGQIQSVLSAVEAGGSETAKEGTLHAAWGYVSNGAVRIAEADAFEPGVDGAPTRTELLTLLDILAKSPYPARSSDGSGMLAWGNWDVRVYAAQGYMALARRGWDPEMEPRLRSMLVDPDPAVRHQVSCALNTLWDVARPTMWELMEWVAEHEKHPATLAFFVNGPMGRMIGADTNRCAAIVSKVIPIATADAAKDEDGRSELAEAVASVAAHLWLGKGDKQAKSWISEWIAGLPTGNRYVGRLIAELRRPLFLKWDGKTDAMRAAEVQDRSRDLLARIVDSGLASLADAKRLLSEGKQEAGVALYRRSSQLLEHAANQLYFGSGASAANRNSATGTLIDRVQKREFIAEYGTILQRIGDTGISSIVYHLVELYEYLAEASPEAVFDRIADLLLGPAAEDGYHFESLAETALVRLVQTYLADYRSVFAEIARRERLVKVLELFSRAGAPDALRLLYELPDLLR